MPVSEAYDVLIAGAGPAGSHAAALLAQQGLRVALLDKAAFPRDKVCGGGLSAKSLTLLGPEVSQVQQRVFTGAWIAWRDQALFAKDMGRTAGSTVLRSEFDAWLVERAQRAGALFHPQTRVEQVTTDDAGVQLQTSRGIYRGRFLLAADGIASVVRAQVFGREVIRYAPAVEVLLPPDRTTLDLEGRVLFDLGGMPRGYGWIFPKRDYLNVGVYSLFGGHGIRAHLDAFLRMHKLAPGTEGLRVCGYAIPVRNLHSRYEHGRVWLLGDAAGFAESVFGEGIYFALRSGALAAQAMAQGNPQEGTYARLVREQLEPELRWSERIGRLLYSAGPLAFDPLARSRLACDWFAGLITGDMGYRRCFWRTLLTAPAWLLGPRHALAAH
jgi:geranylgeranyl reductase family protein